MTYVIPLSAALVASVAFNFILYRRLRTQKKKQPLPDLQSFLQDLNTHGRGMLAVARIDPDDILLRSPRQQR